MASHQKTLLSKGLSKEVRTSRQSLPPTPAKTFENSGQHQQRMKFDFTKEEFDDLIAAAKEARIRWKKARTLWKVRHHAYLRHNAIELEENIERFSRIETMLIERYKTATGEDWHR
tara:strand:- start:1197 stop:1544 length:348 start_codon:yes stop_codon:yes gene_type:complete